MAASPTMSSTSLRFGSRPSLMGRPISEAYPQALSTAASSGVGREVGVSFDDVSECGFWVTVRVACDALQGGHGVLNCAGQVGFWSS